MQDQKKDPEVEGAYNELAHYSLSIYIKKHSRYIQNNGIGWVITDESLGQQVMINK